MSDWISFISSSEKVTETPCIYRILYIIILSLEYHKDLCQRWTIFDFSIFLCVYDVAVERIAMVIAGFFYNKMLKTIIDE